MTAFIRILAVCLILVSCSKKDDEYKEKRYTGYKDNVIEESNKEDFISLNNIYYQNKYNIDKIIDIQNEILNKNINPYYKQSLIFIEQSGSLNQAYNQIMYIFNNKEQLRYMDYNIFLPSNILFNVKNNILDNENNSEDLVSMEEIKFKKADKMYLYTNLSLLKARNIIDYYLEHIIDKDDKKDIQLAHIMKVFSFIAEDRLYQLNSIKKELIKWHEAGGSKIDIIDDEKQDYFLELFKYIIFNDNIDVGEIVKISIKHNQLEELFSLNGYYDIYNFGYYSPAGISNINNIYRVNSYFPAFKNIYNTYNVGNIIKSIILNKEIDVNPDYKFNESYSFKYENPIYFFPFNENVFIAEDLQDIYSFDFINPAFFDYSYGSDQNYIKYSGLPLITSMYNFNILYKDFMTIDKNGIVNFIWKGSNIINQKPDSKKLFTIDINVKDCLLSNSNICKDLESMIYGVKLYKNKCQNKKNCSIEVKDIENYMSKIGAFK